MDTVDLPCLGRETTHGPLATNSPEVVVVFHVDMFVLCTIITVSAHSRTVHLGGCCAISIVKFHRLSAKITDFPSEVDRFHCKTLTKANPDSRPHL